MFPSLRCAVGSVDRLDKVGPLVGLGEREGCVLWRPRRSLGAVIKMALWFGDEKACSALIEDAPLPTWSIHYL